MRPTKDMYVTAKNAHHDGSREKRRRSRIREFGDSYTMRRRIIDRAHRQLLRSTLNLDVLSLNSDTGLLLRQLLDSKSGTVNEPAHLVEH